MKNKIVVLASGSKANAFIIKLENKKILVDIGLSYPKFLERCKEENIQIDKIELLFITHEHIDHVRGLKQFIKNHPNVKILCSAGTAHALQIQANSYQLTTNKRYNFDVFSFIPFELSHDAAEPISFIFQTREHKISLIFDTGYVPEKLVKYFDNSTVVVIEANHDINMIMNSKYPFHLQKRIISDTGHLSNIQAANLLKKIKIKPETLIITAHTSENTNTYEIVQEVFSDFQNVHIAKQEEGIPTIDLGEK
jgi:phosphoribosyl 1,2-cyclic phosphodiesterase